MLFEYLKDHYAGGEPIFLEDIHIDVNENFHVMRML
jgi:hypothetical protein